MARALYGDPFLVVMDKPTPTSTPRARRALGRHQGQWRGGIAIIVAHRPSALITVDQVAVIQNGRMTGFGPKSNSQAAAIRRCRTDDAACAGGDGEALA